MNDTRPRIGWLYVPIILAIVLGTSLTLSSWVSAQESISDSTPETPPTQAIDPPTEVPSEVSTEVPTEVSAEFPTEAATEEPTELPTEEQTSEPIEEPTAETTEESSPESKEELIPIVIWNQSQPVQCALHDGSPSLNYEDSITYHCLVTASVDSDFDMPDTMQIEWKIDVDFSDSYRLELPGGSQASVSSLQPGNATNSTYTLVHPWQQGGVQQLEFDLIITRTTCVVGDQVLTVQASADISTTSDAEIHRESGQPEPVRITISFLPKTESPSVSMSPVDFGSLTWRGDSWGTTYSTGIVTVINDHPCAVSQAQVVHVKVVSSHPGLQPVVTAINFEEDTLSSLPVGDQNQSSTAIVQVPAGFDGNAQVEVVFELAPTDEIGPGEHTFGFEVTVTAAP